MSEPVDIGHGVTISFTEYEGEVAGLIEEHDSPAGRCSGFVSYRSPRTVNLGAPTWEVLQREPLTLAPSIQCRTCGHHGYIREGKWVPA